MNHLDKRIDELYKKIDMELNLESIWHDVSDIPQGEYEIICQDLCGKIWLTNRRQDMKYNQTGWDECAICEDIIRWAYISDLLPKGGEK